MQQNVHPLVRRLAGFLKQWGWLQCFCLCFILLQALTGVMTGLYSLLLHDMVLWSMVLGALLFSASITPFFYFLVFT